MPKAYAETGSPERGFKYQRAGGGKPTPADLSRIGALKIPPAWKGVCINSTNGALQAVGRDAAERWQYLYHNSYVRKREKKTFQRLVRC